MSINISRTKTILPILAVTGALLGAIASLFGAISFLYASFVINDITSVYSNPTRPHPLSGAYEDCSDRILNAQIMAMVTGTYKNKAAQEAKNECKRPPKLDNSTWETNVAFTNKSESSMKNISVSYLALNSEGELLETANIERAILSGSSRFFERGIKISEPAPKALLCIQYSSGLFRKSWKAY